MSLSDERDMQSERPTSGGNDGKFVLLTGIPRSGTTLAAALIDSVEHAVCLSEPDSHVKLLEGSENPSDLATRIAASLQRVRGELLSGEPVEDRRKSDGSMVTNYFGGTTNSLERNIEYVSGSFVRKSVSCNFTLASKHNALYSSIIPALMDSDLFRVVAIVRDPCRVISSWRSLRIPISIGRLPAADKYWLEMRNLTFSDYPLLTKQVLIFNLFCRRYLEFRPELRLLKYEELLARPSALAEAADLAISSGDIERWKNIIEMRYSKTLIDSKLIDEIKSLCIRHDAEAIATLYPDYTT